MRLAMNDTTRQAQNRKREEALIRWLDPPVPRSTTETAFAHAADRKTEKSWHVGKVLEVEFLGNGERCRVDSIDSFGP